MYLRYFFCTLLIALCTARIDAQLASPPAEPATEKATEPRSRILVAARLQFIRSMYKLDADDEAKLEKLVKELEFDQEMYEAQTSVTLRRLRVAIASLARNSDLSEETRAKLTSTFERQYHGIHARSPLGIPNLVKRFEGMLTPNQVAQAHDRICTELGDRLGSDQTEPDMERVEALIAGPIPPAEDPLARSIARRYAPPPANRRPAPTPQRDPTAAQPTPPDVPPSTRPETARPPQGDVTKATPPPGVRPAPRGRDRARAAPARRRPPRPAPPEAEWRERLETASAEFGYTEDQKKITQRALRSCLARAAAHREQHSQDYAAAETIAEPTEKTQRISELNRRLDSLYDELVQRIDAVATIEQRQKVGKYEVSNAATMQAPRRAPPVSRIQVRKAPPAPAPAPKETENQEETPKPQAPKKEASEPQSP